MGKIIETIYHDSVSNITSFGPAVINNSFYMLNDKKPVICTYYNIDKVKSSIDEFGLEADKISGDAYVLPNTITPIEGDYFEIEHITDSSWLFLVTDVQRDTMKDGSNVFKIQYKLEYVDHDRLMQDICGDFDLIETRDGTNVSRVVESTNLKKAKRLDQVAVLLKKYYIELFYNPKVQTFTFMNLTEWRVYDPFMIEFMIRNKILDNGIDDYIYVCHQLMIPATFTLDYDKTFFRAFEKKSTKLLSKSNRALEMNYIDSYGTIFASRYEAYFSASYTYRQSIDIDQPFPDELVYRITDNEIIKNNEGNKDRWKNILVKYFNGGSIEESELESMENYDFNDSTEAFYMIPLLIYCIEESIKTLIK